MYVHKWQFLNLCSNNLLLKRTSKIIRYILYIYFISLESVFRLYLLLGKYESNMIALKLEVETGEEIMNCYSSLLSIYDGSANDEEKM